MREYIKYFNNILHFVSNCGQLFKWFIRQFVNENFKNYIFEIPSVKNVAILANGPSLFKDLEKIETLEIQSFIALNDFISTNVFYSIKPHYYILADPAYFVDNCQNKIILKTLKLLSEVDFEIKLFIPYRYLGVFKQRNFNIFQNNRILVIPYHTNEITGFENISFFLYKKGLSMPKAQNVLIPAIFNSINLGFKEIFLLGVDHSWILDLRVNEHNQVCTYNRHFYENEFQNQLVPFLNVNNQQYKMHEILFDLSLTFSGYHKVNKYAKKMGCNIYNLTKDSFIDAFSKSV